MNRHDLAGTALAALAALAGQSWGAPITFNTALPVRDGGYVLREQLTYMKSTDAPSSMHRQMEASGLVTVLGYGVSRDFTLFGLLPWFDKRLQMPEDSQENTRRTAGVGDLTLLGRYTVYEDNGPGRTLRLAPFLGVKAPTGAHNARDHVGPLPRRLLPGSGSWDTLGGAVFTYQTPALEFDSQLSFQANRDADGFRAGHAAEVDASLQYRLWPQKLGAGVPDFLYGVLESSLVHAANDRANGNDDPNSGGNTLSIAPGLQYVTRKWIAEAGVRIPARQHLNGTALRSDYIVSTGLRINF
ncbi:transporter [Duganella sp. FT3S]|uniref:Transporter n=1 Tax=Rugamonas fusca TaxID=2758568 RepID=A0A7W2EDY5_9BURK|nr:transporter [Rugamonas fusca]MBA5604183.1 transporter [Rugamonas fusca]